ncbi:myo-inosose-2 dehydratase [Nordella sp. HKS 07]|uniref:myo-inosose-2 dehydratase n=1 Tax=Nordella sp. HKS 07 TaxID=2712222 RepID=UPI0013E15F29|nr:myo-inosose-2 dehydratase [Nordella sp. HKS 07]QIG47902.1 myo-inosose-2 dehydratase [Nordella sp. HKS 07]
MAIRIGANPIGWSNDDMQELGGWIPLEQCLSEAKAAGFVGMELGNKFPREAAKLRPILEKYGHALIGGWHSIFLIERDAETEFAEAAHHRKLLKDMGTNVFIVAECTRTIHGDKSRPLSTRPKMTEAEWKRFTERLTKLAELLRAEGFQLVYHHHMGTVVQTPEEIDRLMQETGEAVHLLLDTGHATWGGADPVKLARTYRKRISHIHCKDVRPAVRKEAEQKDWSFLDAVIAGVYTVPGDGMVDYVSVFKELPGYSGWVVVEAEQDPKKAEPATYARLGHDNLVRFLKEGGLT